MLYVNTKTLNLEHKLDSERAILMWRIQWEMLTIKVWENNWNVANTFWQILKWGKENTESSNLPCHSSILLCTTINWIMYSKNWNMLQKLILQLDSFRKILRLECVDTFTVTKTILIWKDLTSWRTQADMTNVKNRMKEMVFVDICTRERANTKWKFYKFTILTIFASLLTGVPMCCKMQSYLNHFCKTIMWIASLLREIPDNPTMTIYICLERQLYICRVTKNWMRIPRKFLSFSSITVRKETFQIIKVSIWMTFQKSMTCCNSKSFFMTLICRWRNDWWAPSKKFSKVWQKCQTFTLQRSHLLHQ